MQENKWSLINSSDYKKDETVSCKWIFSIKEKYEEKVYKARLLARDFLLKDEERTFSLWLNIQH